MVGRSNRRWVAALAAAVCVASSPGLAADLEPGRHSRSARVSNLDRHYVVVVPRGYESARPAPLVLDFHGFRSSIDEQARVSGFRTLAERERFILVFPEGYSGVKDGDAPLQGRSYASWNGGPLCCGPARNDAVDDVEFTREIVRAVSEEANIDPQRVYATGISNGGAMVHRLGCEAADLFAAIAPLAFPIALEPKEGCRPSRPIPVIYFAGLTDTLVPFAGGETLGGSVPSAPETFQYWQRVNDCEAEPPIETYAVGTSRCQTAPRCAGAVRVTLCSLEASQQSPAPGHVLYLNPDISIADVAWEFLSRFQLPPATRTGKSESTQ